MEYAIRRQRDRRNLTRAEITGFVTRAFELLDRVKTAGRPPEELAQSCANSGKSASETADQLQISQAPRDAPVTSQPPATSNVEPAYRPPWRVAGSQRSHGARQRPAPSRQEASSERSGITFWATVEIKGRISWIAEGLSSHSPSSP